MLRLITPQSPRFSSEPTTAISEIIKIIISQQSPPVPVPASLFITTTMASDGHR